LLPTDGQTGRQIDYGTVIRGILVLLFALTQHFACILVMVIRHGLGNYF